MISRSFLQKVVIAYMVLLAAWMVVLAVQAEPDGPRGDDITAYLFVRGGEEGEPTSRRLGMKGTIVHRFRIARKHGSVIARVQTDAGWYEQRLVHPGERVRLFVHYRNVPAPREKSMNTILTPYWIAGMRIAGPTMMGGHVMMGDILDAEVIFENGGAKVAVGTAENFHQTSQFGLLYGDLIEVEVADP